MSLVADENPGSTRTAISWSLDDDEDDLEGMACHSILDSETFGAHNRYPLQQRGPAGFLDGASLRLSRKVLSSAIGWAVYEGLLRVQHRRSIQRMDN